MNPIFWYRAVHYPKSSFIISLKLWRQGTSCLWFSLRTMYILEINDENVCRCTTACIHACSGISVCPLLKRWSTNKLRVNKVKAEEISLKFFSSLILCSGSLKEIDIQFSLWDLCEIQRLISRPWEKEAACLLACLLQQWVRFWSNILEMWYVLSRLGEELACSRADLIVFLQLI